MRYGSSTLAAQEGGWAYVVVAVPILLGIVPLVATRARLRAVLSVGAGTVLGGLVVVSAASVGLLYVPAALALFVAAAAAPTWRAAG